MLVDEGCLPHTQREPEINIAECVIIARSMTDKDSVGVYIAGDCRVRNCRLIRCAKPAGSHISSESSAQVLRPQARSSCEMALTYLIGLYLGVAFKNVHVYIGR